MRKDRLSLVTALAVTGILSFSSPALAIAEGYGVVSAKKEGKVITLGNDAISRTWSLDGKKLKTSEIDNKLGKTKFVPGEGSEEFVIGSLIEPERKEPSAALTSVKPSKSEASSLKVEASSVQESESAIAANAIDGDPKTHWAAKDGETTEQWLTIEFGKEVSISSLKYTPRYAEGHRYQCSGQIYSAKLQKWNGSDWVDIQDLAFNRGAEAGEQTVTLNSATSASKVRILVSEGYFWDSANQPNVKTANIAEVDFFDADGTSLVHAAPDASTAAWSIEASSNQPGDGDGPDALIDGNTGTYWHSAYNNNGEGDKKFPVKVTLDRGESGNPFQTVKYLSRGISNGRPGNGSWNEFRVYASDTEDGLFSKENLLKNEKGSTKFKASYAGIEMSGNNVSMKELYFGLENA